MTTHPLRTERSGPQTASVLTDLPFKPQLVKVVFRDVTSLHVSRSATWAAASVTRTVLTEIIKGARSAAAEEVRTRLIPQDLISAIDRSVEVQVGSAWYLHSPTFHGLDAAQVVREGGVKRFGTVSLVVPGEPAPAPLLKDPLLALSTRHGDGRTVGGDDVLAAVTMQLFGDLRQRAITEAAEMTRKTSAN